MFQTLADQVFELHDQGYNYAEIAEMINVPVEMIADILLGFQEFFLGLDK